MRPRENLAELQRVASEKNLAETRELTDRFERELERQAGQFTAEIERLVESYERSSATQQAMIDTLHKILNPTVTSDPPEMALGEEAEHLAFAIDSKTADPGLASAMQDLGLFPDMTIEPATD